MPNSRIRSRCRFAAGGDGVWVGNLFYTGFQDDLRSFLSLISYLSFTSGLSFRLLKLSGLGRVSTGWVREVTTKGVGWASEDSDLVAPLLNLVLYMHLRIFAYTSTDLITCFEYMELILTSGTLKNFRFLMRFCLSTDRAPVIKLICSTFQPWRCITVLMTSRRDVYWFSTVLLDLIRYRSQTLDILLCSKIQKVPDVLPTCGRTAFPSERLYPSETFLHDCLLWNALFDSSIF
jgi:hypothetical protein